MNLAYYKEEISDDFQSTFTVKSENILMNMLGMLPDDFTKLESIIKNYIPDAKVSYKKIDAMPQPGMPDYGMYLIRIANEPA